MHEQYRRQRFPTDYEVKIAGQTDVQHGIVIDVNQSGARLIGLSNLKRGDQIDMQVLDDRFRATVRWHGAERTGVSFAMPLPRRVVDLIRRSATAGAAGRQARADRRDVR